MNSFGSDCFSRDVSIASKLLHSAANFREQKKCFDGHQCIYYKNSTLHRKNNFKKCQKKRTKRLKLLHLKIKEINQQIFELSQKCNLIYWIENIGNSKNSGKIAKLI